MRLIGPLIIYENVTAKINLLMDGLIAKIGLEFIMFLPQLHRVLNYGVCLDVSVTSLVVGFEPASLCSVAGLLTELSALKP